MVTNDPKILVGRLTIKWEQSQILQYNNKKIQLSIQKRYTAGFKYTLFIIPVNGNDKIGK